MPLYNYITWLIDDDQWLAFTGGQLGSIALLTFLPDDTTPECSRQVCICYYSQWGCTVMYITAQCTYILRISVHFEHIRLSQQLNSISYLLSTLMYHLKFWLIITSLHCCCCSNRIEILNSSVCHGGHSSECIESTGQPSPMKKVVEQICITSW